MRVATVLVNIVLCAIASVIMFCELKLELTDWVPWVVIGVMALTNILSMCSFSCHDD